MISANCLSRQSISHELCGLLRLTCYYDHEQNLRDVRQLGDDAYSNQDQNGKVAEVRREYALF